MTAIFEQPLYGRLAQYKVRAILEALDAFAQSSKSESLPLPPGLTIEHVMPQTWSTYWPLSSEAKADPVTEQKSITRRNALVNTLGNLTLITGGLNPALSNSSWSVKRPELLKFTKLNLNQYFHSPEASAWDENGHPFTQRISVFTDHKNLARRRARKPARKMRSTRHTSLS